MAEISISALGVVFRYRRHRHRPKRRKRRSRSVPSKRCSGVKRAKRRLILKFVWAIGNFSHKDGRAPKSLAIYDLARYAETWQTEKRAFCWEKRL